MGTRIDEDCKALPLHCGLIQGPYVVLLPCHCRGIEARADLDRKYSRHESQQNPNSHFVLQLTVKCRGVIENSSIRLAEDLIGFFKSTE